MHQLTDGKIIKRKDIKKLLLNKFNQIKLTDAKFYFLVISVTRDFSKIIIYPIENSPILKIVLIGSKLEQMHIFNVSKKIIESKITILHTSGLVSVQNSYIDEIYLTNDETSLTDFRNWLFAKKVEHQIETIEEQWFKK